MLLAQGYKYDEGKSYFEKILKGSKSKPYPGKARYSSLRLYRVLKESIEGFKTSEEQVQKGSGSVVADTVAASAFIDGQMDRHARRSKIHENVCSAEEPESDPDADEKDKEEKGKGKRSRRQSRTAEKEETDNDGPKPKRRKAEAEINELRGQLLKLRAAKKRFGRAYRSQ